MNPYEKKTILERLREEKKKLKNMNGKDKRWYIWEYYKIPIAATAFILFFIVSVGMTIYGNRFDTAFSCIILNSVHTQESIIPQDYFDVKFRPYTNIPEDELVEVNSTMSISFGDNTAMSPLSSAELPKLFAMIMSKELDVFIGNKDSIDHFGNQGVFYDFKELLSPEEYEKIENQLYFVTVEETGQKMAAGIFIDSMDFEHKTGLSIDGPIFSVLVNSTHTDTVVDLIHYMFGL